MTLKHEILFGIHSVTEAIKADKRIFQQVMLSGKKSSQRIGAIETLATRKNIPIKWVGSKTLDKITRESKHQGAVLKASPLPVGNALDVPEQVQQSERPCFILIMENMEDPHNMGALIRTALCAGVGYILIPRDRSAAPSPTVSRASAGAMEHADIFMMTNTAAVLKALKQSGVWVSGLDADGGKSLYDADLTGHIALVIGGEHKGIRPLVKKGCDFLLSIPNLGRINSLNASVAGGIAMFEALRQRT